jgi:uncharacterized protein YbjT (DUF2867 family)
MIVVTGASGLVGANMVRALLAQGLKVRALVHHDRRALQGLEVEQAVGNVRDLESLKLFAVLSWYSTWQAQSRWKPTAGLRWRR